MIVITERGFRRPGQGRGIDDQLRFLRRGINQTIRQHQTTFSVGVHDFHSLAIAIANDVAEFKGITADQVVRTAQIQLHAFVQAAGNRERQRAGNRCRAAHIGLHRIHKRALFDAVAAGIEGDTFPDQASVHRGLFIAGWVVIQRQQYRRTLGAAANGMQAKIALLTQVFTFRDAVCHVVAGDAAQQIDSSLSQLFRAKLFRRRVNGIPHPVNNRQPIVQLAFLRVVQRRPFHLTAAFRPFVTGPECPRAVGIPAFAAQRDMFDPHPVDFTRRALNQTEVVFTVQMQGDAVIINAVSRFFSPARVGGLGRQRNLHGFGHFIFILIWQRSRIWQKGRQKAAHIIFPMFHAAGEGGQPLIHRAHRLLCGGSEQTRPTHLQRETCCGNYSASSNQTSRIASRIFSLDAVGLSSKSSSSQIH